MNLALRKLCLNFFFHHAVIQLCSESSSWWVSLWINCLPLVWVSSQPLHLQPFQCSRSPFIQSVCETLPAGWYLHGPSDSGLLETCQSAARLTARHAHTHNWATSVCFGQIRRGGRDGDVFQLLSACDSDRRAAKGRVRYCLVVVEMNSFAPHEYSRRQEDWEAERRWM